ncbi:hypothetical protein [Arvimicrobium flavum]|uniref:hypothetical protein n=1 Tax=Arvimicrobium flavum TaxID=3393320 RepID=UPI00237A786C|nr:hypothetical protein [Mesorhizobium shangrilense]
MKSRWFAILAVSAAFAVTATVADATDDTPAQVAQKFCDTHRSGTAEAELATMALLTPSLKAAMDEAVKKNDVWETAHPGEKPPLGDGVPFQSYPDVAKECVAGKVSADGTEVDIEYKFDDPEANWTDRVKLALVEGKLMVDDILYGVNDFQDGLRESLSHVGEDVEIEE